MAHPQTSIVLVVTIIVITVLVAVLVTVGVSLNTITTRGDRQAAQVRSRGGAAVAAGGAPQGSGSESKSRVVLVTGGTSGIGLAAAKLFANKGAHVVYVCGRSPARWEDVLKTLSDRERTVMQYVRADVRIESDVIALMQRIADECGRLDVAINNAGVAAGAPIVDQDMRSYASTAPSPSLKDDCGEGSSPGDTSISWTLPPPQPCAVPSPSASASPSPSPSPSALAASVQRTGQAECQVAGMTTPSSRYCENSLYTDALGTAICMKHELILMRSRNDLSSPGTIVNVASVNSFWGAPGASMYAAGKAAVLLMTRSVAAEQAEVQPPMRPIRINCVAPGPVDTPLLRNQFSSVEAMNKMAPAGVPMGRIAAPEEIAHGIYFLSDDEAASYVTGACLTIDGGLTASPMLIPNV